jgi:hypothetical protein
MMNRSLAQILFSLAISAMPVASDAQTFLEQDTLFYRCYGQLTQQRPTLSEPLLAQVKSGTKTALAACTELLDSAQFTAADGTKIADETNTAAKATLNTLHQLHRSWARERSLVRTDNQNNMTIIGTRVWYEDSPMGSYITRALFSPRYDVTSILSGSDFVQPVRATMNPPKVSDGVPNLTSTNPSDWMFGADQPFAPRGELLGIQKISLAPIAYLPAVAIGNNMPNFENIGTSPVATQPWTNVNFPTVELLSAPIAPQTTAFAIRARGTLQIPASGAYTFTLDADDAGAMILDGERLVSNRATGTLSPGAHTIEIHYLQRLTTARLNFSWQGPGIPTRTIVPASAFSGLTAEYYTQTLPPPIAFTGNEGGGFIGNHNYLMTTYQETNPNYAPDGQLMTNRSFGRAVIKDTLCREVPVVRDADATQFVSPTAIAPFRQEAACTTCHATLDRLAGGTIRGLRWNLTPQVDRMAPLPDLHGIAGLRMNRSLYAASSNWSTTADPDYANRAPYGNLYFRNYRGELVDVVIKSIPELAAAIAAQDDFYTCFAKRYYDYFLGIDVALGDPGDPSSPNLNLVEEHHRGNVIALGLKLKTHKSLRQLILDIIGSDEYRMVDFGISYGGKTNG